MSSLKLSTRFFFTDWATPEIYTLSLHDALPILEGDCFSFAGAISSHDQIVGASFACDGDRKSTRLNFSHRTISYAVFCLKKKRHLRPSELNFATPPPR